MGNNNQYKNYFSNRGVSSNFYEKYKLPKYLVDALPKSLESNILDIGCGLGQTMIAVKKMGYKNVQGVDISNEAINFSGGMDLQVEKINTINDYAVSCGRKYDFIIMSHVLEHLKKNEVIETLKNIKQNLLSPEGKLLLTVPNAQSNTGAYWAYEDFTHNTLFTAGSLLFVLKEAGFSKISFLNSDNTKYLPFYLKYPIKILLFFYRTNIDFWNKITGSSFHKPSPKIFSFEIRVLSE